MPYSEPVVTPSLAPFDQYVVDVTIPVQVESSQSPEEMVNADARLRLSFSLQDFYGPVQPEGDDAFQVILDHLAALPALPGATGPAVIQARKAYDVYAEVTPTEVSE